MAKLINSDDRTVINHNVTLIARAAPNAYGLDWYTIASQCDNGMWTYYVATKRADGHYARNGTMYWGQLPTLADVQDRAVASGYILAEDR